MADKTSIEWSDATWNPITGCSVISPGCTNCYAMKLAGTRLAHIPSRAGLTTMSKAGPVWNGQVRLNEQWLDQPLRWKRPRKIFVCAHGDLFAEQVPDEWIDRVFAVMALAPQHTFQVLTKRAERMADYVSQTAEQWHGNSENFADRFQSAMDWNYAWINDIDDMEWPLPNVWLGVSAEDQERADERIPHLLGTPAAVRFVSAEPLLGPLDLTRINHEHTVMINALTGEGGWPVPHAIGGPALDWIIVGGESGPNARPMHPQWARDIRDQCAAAGVAHFHKQNGQFEVVYDRDRDDPDWQRCGTIARQTPTGRWLNLEGGHGFHGDRVVRAVPVGKKRAGRLLDGVEHNGMPGR